MVFAVESHQLVYPVVRVMRRPRDALSRLIAVPIFLKGRVFGGVYRAEGYDGGSSAFILWGSLTKEF